MKRNTPEYNKKVEELSSRMENGEITDYIEIDMCNGDVDLEPVNYDELREEYSEAVQRALNKVTQRNGKQAKNFEKTEVNRTFAEHL